VKITVTTNDGQIVIDILHNHDIGDLSHPHCRGYVCDTLRKLQLRDRELEAELIEFNKLGDQLFRE
jgi:hypothetical protein